MPISTAQVASASPAATIADLCEQLRARAASRPEIELNVEWSNKRGAIDFGWARCTMEAGPETLALCAEAANPDDLRSIQELLRRHLERAGLQVGWVGTDSLASDSADPRAERDAMRAFHHRARHAKDAG
jgi:hypothetical protein